MLKTGPKYNYFELPEPRVDSQETEGLKRKSGMCTAAFTWGYVVYCAVNSVYGIYGLESYNCSLR